MFAKLLLFVAFSGIFASPLPQLPEGLQQLASINEECMQSSGATEQMSVEALAGSFPDVPALKEYLLCGAQKLGIVSESGEPQPEVIKEYIKTVINAADAKIEEAVQECAVSKDTPEETAFAMAKCFYDKKNGGA